MSNISPSSSKIQTESVAYQAPVSESSLTAIGAAVNYCLDGVASNSSSISSLTSSLNNLNRLKLNQVIAQTLSGTYTCPANTYFVGRVHIASIGGGLDIVVLNRYSEVHLVLAAGGSTDPEATVFLEPGDSMSALLNPGTGGTGFNMVGIEFKSVTGP